MPPFGAHLSVSALQKQPSGRGRNRKTAQTITGPAAALERARQLKCDCVQLFLRPNRQWHAPKYTPEMIRQFAEAARAPVRRSGRPLEPIVSHASYLINIAGPPGRRGYGSDVASRSLRALKDESRRAGRLGVPYVVLHPGNHMGDGEEKGLRRMVAALDELLDEFADCPMIIETPKEDNRGREMDPTNLRLLRRLAKG